MESGTVENAAAPAAGRAAGELLDDVLALREAVAAEAEPMIARFVAAGAERDRIANLAHYLAIRHHDLRPLQRELMAHGVSSLGRLESRVMPTLDAVTAALAALSGRPSPCPAPDSGRFFAGEARLAAATDALFGPPPAHRRGRIMVTLPSEAATDPEPIADLARRGMDIARINCAHDNAEAWRAMARNVHAAGEAAGRRLSVLMDIAGPKIRTGTVAMTGDSAKVHVGDRVRLVAEGPPRVDRDVPFSAQVSLPELVPQLKVGDRIRYDDGKLAGAVEAAGPGAAIVRITHAKPNGTKLKSEKGLNVPDTMLSLSPLTGKDEADLAAVAEFGDMVGYSYVSGPEDIDLLEAALAKLDGPGPVLGLVAKIERPQAVRNLPDIIARTVGRRPFGVMIARGDLAAEIGFERLAEMQEEILWICEAASVPMIWATQVLEDVVKEGVPSRGEMTDAAMAARAECVMLNKGPSVGAAVDVLDRLMARMDEHVFKKTPTLRALKSW